MSEEIFDGYDEKTYTGTVALTKLAEIPPYAQGSDNVYEGTITSDMGYIKDGTL